MKSQRSVHKITNPLSQTFDKYDFYRKAVQSAESDVEFIHEVYTELRNKKPISLREDFCGTFALSCEWVKLNSKHQAIGIDFDPEPLEYGKNNYLKKLTEHQQKRISIIEQNVLLAPLPEVDICLAMNFSYFLFKKKEQLKKYFLNVFNSLNAQGIFIIDLFGGSLCASPNEEKTNHKKFTYYWDQVNFDPVSNEAQFYIHFQERGKKRVEKVFSYDWRMWTIPELRELMEEVGFLKTHVYWEGTNRLGGGNGIFTRTKKGESCLSWIAYIVGEK